MNKHLKDERDICCGVVSLPPDLIGAAAASVICLSLIDGAPSVTPAPPPLCLNKPRNSLRKKQKQRAGVGDIFDDATQQPKR